jgi:glycosyltransferase involved in cell wall biosynthesis
VKKPLFIVVPSLAATGPVKGAIALANGLAERFDVTLIALKAAGDVVRPVDEVSVLSLARFSWPRRWWVLRQLLRSAAEKPTVVSLCFSADFMMRTLRPYARIVSSVRGNLAANYRFDYGWKGGVLAWLHYRILRGFDRVVAMSKAMEAQLRGLGIERVAVIPNFIEESDLAARASREKKRPEVGFAFVGSLSTRKRPELLLESLARIPGDHWRLELVGDGPLRPRLEKGAPRPAQIVFHGQVTAPWSVLEDADFLVLPSESEGISRAVLEALYLGIPCILRDVEAASEVIEHGKNGYLFRNDAELAGLLESIVEGRLSLKREGSLLPEKFRQSSCVTRFAEIIDG